MELRPRAVIGGRRGVLVLAAPVNPLNGLHRPQESDQHCDVVPGAPDQRLGGQPARPASFVRPREGTGSGGTGPSTQQRVFEGQKWSLPDVKETRFYPYASGRLCLHVVLSLLPTIISRFPSPCREALERSQCSSIRLEESSVSCSACWAM